MPRKRLNRRPSIFDKLRKLYGEMQDQYRQVAASLEFTCQDCSQNCCVSYFQHHTYIEWAYLWQGLQELPPDKLSEYRFRAEANVAQCEAALELGVRPRVMCPVNDEGLCSIYTHRLMICRMHGTAHILKRPGQLQTHFPGCHRFEGLLGGRTPSLDDATLLDRTPLYLRLAQLEKDYLGSRIKTLPRVSMTLSEMIMAGPPEL